MESVIKYHIDLGRDDFKISGLLINFIENSDPVRLEQLFTLTGCALPLKVESTIFSNLTNRHLGTAQPLDKLQSLQIGLSVYPSSGRIFCSTGNQLGPFVVTQRVL